MEVTGASAALPVGGAEEGTGRSARELARVLSGSPLTIGLAALLVSLLRAVRPSAWTDELATLAFASRSEAQFWELISSVDAVHALYYREVRLWQHLVGDSVFAARSMSALAIGLAAAGVVLLARELDGWALGRWAGWLFLAVPGLTRAGSEARSGAVVVLLVVAAGFCLTRAMSRGRSWWVLYTLVSVLAVLTFAQTALALLAHGITVAWSHGLGPTLVRWATSAVAVLALTAPFLWFSLGQRQQISWLESPTPTWAVSRTVAIWFGGSIPLTLLLVAAAAVPVWLAMRYRHRTPAAVRLALPWLVLPSVALLAVSVVSTPMFHPRYVVHSCAALALLAAVGLRAVRSSRLRATWAAAVATFAALATVTTSGPFGFDQSDWSTAAAVVHANAAPGDGVLFVPDGDAAARGPRRALEAYPGQFEGLVDLGDDGTLVEPGELLSGGYTLDNLPPDSLEHRDRVFLMLAYLQYPDEAKAALADLTSLGFQTSVLWTGPSTQVVLLTRSGA